MSVHMKANGAYFVRYRQNGKQVQKGFGKGEQAEKLAEEFNASISKKVSNDREWLDNDTPSEVKYLDELALVYFQRDLLKEERPWVKDWKNILNKRILPTLGQIPLERLTKVNIEKFIVSEFPKAKAVTHGNYISYLKIMFNYGVKHGYIKSNPLANWTKPKQEQKGFLLDLATIKKIRDASPPHLAFAIELMCNTGLRTGKSELLSLKWEHVLWDESAIKVFATKTSKWRTMPIKPDFMQKLRVQKELATTDYLIEYKGKPVKSIHKAFRTACNKAGVEKSVILYDIRHWYCSTLLTTKTPIHTVSRLMGHSSANMTLNRYAHVVPGDAEQAVASLPSID